MDLLQLKYFRELAYSQHMTELSEKLHISQPSLSITISKLEEELGVKLFDRIGRRIVLNEYGKIFLKHVDTIFNELEYAREEIKEAKKACHKKVILATTGTIFLSNFIIEFLEKNKDINLKQFISNNEEAIELLEKGEIDFAITYPPLKSENIETVILFEDEIMLVIPENHHFSKNREISLYELKDEKFINLVDHYDFRKVTDEIYKNAGFTPNIVFEGELSLLEKLMKAGTGVALVPKSIVELYSDFPAKTLKLKEPKFKWTIGFSWLKNKYMVETLKRFKDCVFKYYNIK
ncbi:LysR family transcriptional regulator [Marinitoga sp. 1138]|uniref:LysR family transcriptional regulator n=1 Tax=Marinitoga sp. 1138 TaxID=1643334 RepID=UPI001585E128|nr:LysR family transcriptional regulator [Marinitoga sp. 1138]NUU97129.1 hypothetical protein [Marinitoga sp. 1138]